MNAVASGAPSDHAEATRQLLHALAASGRQIAIWVAGEPLLALALTAMALVILGGLVRRPLPLLGGAMRFFGNLILIFAFLGAIAEVMRFDHGFDLSFSGSDTPEQQVAGRETRIALAPDGHFWLRAEVNGVSRRFLVDTGATLTTVSPATAEAAGLTASPGSAPVLLNTANGTSTGTLVTIASLRVGNVVARHIDAVVAPGLQTNVLGMNFLSSLASWRVEGHTMILVPHHPQV